MSSSQISDSLQKIFQNKCLFSTPTMDSQYYSHAQGRWLVQEMIEAYSSISKVTWDLHHEHTPSCTPAGVRGEGG